MYQYLDYHDISTCKKIFVYRPKCPVSFLLKPDFSLVDWYYDWVNLIVLNGITCYNFYKI